MNKDNNKKVLDLIHSSITSESGDGDALWLSKHTSLDEIIILINEYNIKKNIDWTVKKESNYINWGIDQEWATITCDEQFFNSQPSWIVLRINY